MLVDNNSIMLLREMRHFDWSWLESNSFITAFRSYFSVFHIAFILRFILNYIRLKEKGKKDLCENL
jgi:hypothetical protein